MPSTFPHRAGANARGTVIGLPVVHLFSAGRDRAVEHFCRPRGVEFNYVVIRVRGDGTQIASWAEIKKPRGSAIGPG